MHYFNYQPSEVGVWLSATRCQYISPDDVRHVKTLIVVEGGVPIKEVIVDFGGSFET